MSDLRCMWLGAAFVLGLSGGCDRGAGESAAGVAAVDETELERAREAFVSTLQALVDLDRVRPRPLHFDQAAYPGEVASFSDALAAPPAGCALSLPMEAVLDEETHRQALVEVNQGRRAATRLPPALLERLAACRPAVDGVFRAGRALGKPDLTLGEPSTSPVFLAAHVPTRVRFALVEIRRLAAEPSERDRAVDRCLDLLAFARDAATLDNLRAGPVLAFRGQVANVCAAALQGASAPRRVQAEASLAGLEAGLPTDGWHALRNRVDDGFVVLRGRIDDALVARAPGELRASLSAMRREDFGVIRPADMARMFGQGGALPDLWSRLRYELATVLSLLRVGLVARRFHEAKERWPERHELAEGGPTFNGPRDARPGGAVELTVAGANLVLTARAPAQRGGPRVPREGDFIEFDARGFEAAETPDTPDLIVHTVTPDGRSPSAQALARVEAQAVTDRDAVRALAERVRHLPAPVAPADTKLTGPAWLRQALAPWLRAAGFTPSPVAPELFQESWVQTVSEGAELSILFGPGQHVDESPEAFTAALAWARPGTQWVQESLLARATPAALAAFEAASAASAARAPFRYRATETSRLTSLLAPPDPRFGDQGSPFTRLVEVVLPPGLTRAEFDRVVAAGSLPPGASVRERITVERPDVILHVRDAQDVSTYAALIVRTLPDALLAFAEDVYVNAAVPRKMP